MEIEYVTPTGTTCRCSLAEADLVAFEGMRPVRKSSCYKGQPSMPGFYWFATTGAHVAYESRFELAHLTLLDFDPDVTAVAAQPFRLHYRLGARPRRHVPDFFARLRDGAGLVVDVKGALRAAAPANATVFAATRAACAEVGWAYRVATEPCPVRLANVLWLAGFRRPIHAPTPVTAALLAATAETGVGIDDAVTRAAAASDMHPALVRPVLFHLLWRGLLRADLTVPLSGGTVVGVATAAAGVG